MGQGAWIQRMFEEGPELKRQYSEESVFDLSLGNPIMEPPIEFRQELVDGFIHCNRILGYVNAPALMQYVVRRLQSVTISVAEYQRQRDFLYDHLGDMGYSIVKPQGTFYMFPKSPLEDDITFVKEKRTNPIL